MLSAGRGTAAFRGEVEGALEGDRIVMLTEGGESGGMKSRLFNLTVRAEERDAMASERRPVRPCHILSLWDW